MTRTPADPTLRLAYSAVACAGAVLALAALSFLGPRAGASALIGAVLALVNLLVLARSVTKLLAGARSGWAGVALLKFAGLFVCTYALLDGGLVSPLGLSLGFLALPVGIVISGLKSAPRGPDSAPNASPAAAGKD